MVFNEPIDDNVYRADLVKLLKGIECFGVLVDWLLLCMYIKVLKKKKFCHPNLQLMLLFQPSCQGISLAFRVLRHILQATGILNRFLSDAVNYCSDICLATSAQAMVIMAIERVYAMWRVEDYEEDKRKTLGYALIIQLCSTTFVLVTSWYARILSAHIMYIMAFILMFISTAIFIVLPCVSFRAYRRVAQLREATIAQRFRTSRNLRAARLLMYLSPYKSCTNVLSLCFYIYTFELSDKMFIPLYGEVYYLYNCVQMFIQMMLTMNLHDTLRSELWRLVSGKRIIDERSLQIRSATGDKLVYSTSEQSAMHFIDMQKAWESRLPKNEIVRQTSGILKLSALPKIMSMNKSNKGTTDPSSITDQKKASEDVDRSKHYKM